MTVVLYNPVAHKWLECWVKFRAIAKNVFELKEGQRRTGKIPI